MLTVNEFVLHPADYPAYNLHPFFLSVRDISYFLINVRVNI